MPYICHEVEINLKPVIVSGVHPQANHWVAQVLNLLLSEISRLNGLELRVVPCETEGIMDEVFAREDWTKPDILLILSNSALSSRAAALVNHVNAKLIYTVADPIEVTNYLLGGDEDFELADVVEHVEYMWERTMLLRPGSTYYSDWQMIQQTPDSVVRGIAEYLEVDIGEQPVKHIVTETTEFAQCITDNVVGGQDLRQIAPELLGWRSVYQSGKYGMPLQ